MDPDQTTPIGAVCSVSTLFASILNSSVMLAIICSRRHFQMHFFLGTLRVKMSAIFLHKAILMHFYSNRTSDRITLEIVNSILMWFAMLLFEQKHRF